MSFAHGLCAPLEQRLAFLNQYLAGFLQEGMHLLLDLRVNHNVRSFAMRARKRFCRTEQPAYQRALSIHLTAIAPQVRTIPICQCSRVFFLGFDGQS
jgi:hypothetical protein